MFIAPSAWYPESHKILQWRALALTRAHENNAYLHAADQARPAFIGYSIATSPLGHIMKEAGATSTSFTVHLDLATIEQSKQVLPMNSL